MNEGAGGGGGAVSGYSESAAAQRAAFLAALHDGCEGLRELRALPSRARIFAALSDVASVEGFIARAAATDNLYVAVATRIDVSSGALVNCRHMAALFADVDFKTTPEPKTRARLASSPLPPSASIHSGGGLHCYWFLREPIDLRDPAACAKARQLLRRLALVLGADITAAEPARVLRLPGTFNRKPEYGTPRPVTLEILEPSRRYNPIEFDDMLPPDRADTPAGGTLEGGGFVLPDRIPAHEPGRNHTLWRYGRSLRAKKWRLPQILAELERVNRECCEPPLPADELGDIAHNVMTEPNRPTFVATGPGADAMTRGGRPQIDTANLGLDDMATAAWAAIEAANTPLRVFLYAGALAWLVSDATGSPTVEVMNQDHVRHHLADVATFIRWSPASRSRAPEKKPAFPPEALAADMRAVPHATLPRLRGLVQMPVFRKDGQLLTVPGFDAASGLYYAPPIGLTLPPIPTAPSLAEIEAARQALCGDLLGDFPFVSDADRAHAVALLLTPLLRELVSGCVPLFVVSKPTPRTGAGLLTKVVSIVQGGSPIAATTISRDEEEMRKRLTSLLIPSPAMILLDNLHGRLDSAALAAILTTSTWEDRVLGRSQTVRLSVRTVFAATGNNVALSNEMAGRSVLIRLDPKIEDPSTRTGFRHADLEAWATSNRAQLLWSALVLGQAWIAAGRLMGAAAFGGFGEWAGVLGGVLKVSGIAGFLANRRTLFEQADEESAHVRAFLADWYQAYGDAPVLTKEVIELTKGHPLPIESRTDQGTLIRLGQLIQSLEDRRYDLGEHVVAVRRAGESRRAVRWRLECESDESRESSSVNTRTHARAQAPAQAREGGSAGRDSSDSQTHIDELRL